MPLNFSGQNLRDRNFEGQNLTGANFSGADIRGANFTEANLRGANFSYANAQEVDFSNALINKADFSRADLSGSNFQGKLLDQVIFTEAKLFRANLSRADLCKANFSGANLEKANLSTSNLSYASFIAANLSYADLDTVNLEKANLSGANLKGVNFKGSVDMDGWELSQVAVFEGTNFEGANLTEVDLSITVLHAVNFHRADLSGANLNQADLSDAQLVGANLRNTSLVKADLNNALLQQTDLYRANLREATALGANFTNACLTEACLEAWNIDSNTNLENVDCQYVYLLRNQQERRPSSGDFAPGEFTKLFQEALNTVDLIFRNGVDWKAFVAAFQTVQVDNDGTELTIQSIENKGDGVVVVRVSVPETADKAKIHSGFNQNYDVALKALEAKYHAELKAKDEQITIYREKSADMTEILRLLANRPVTVEVTASAESKAMSDSTDKSQTDKSQTVNIGGNVTGSTINLGAISGSVSNVVNQLPSAPDPSQPGIKELLIELQAAIEVDADLPEKGKASALENVKVLAEVVQDPEQPEKKGLGIQAVTFLKGAASFLPDTAKLAEACTKLLPLITKALGLPF